MSRGKQIGFITLALCFTLVLLITSSNFYPSNQLEKVITQTNLEVESSFNDSLKTFEVDEYPITLELLENLSRKNGILQIESGEIVSYDTAWFTDDTQTIAIKLATDYHRFYTYHFLNNDYPKELQSQIGFNTKDGNLATTEQINANFQGILKQSKAIPSSYFISRKGIEMGMNKEKAKSIYGNPDSSTIIEQTEKLIWSFHGDNEDLIHVTTEKPRAKDSYGHKIIMYFKKNKLIAHVIFNDIP